MAEHDVNKTSFSQKIIYRFSWNFSGRRQIDAGKGTVSGGNFERWGSFERRSIFPFNDLYYQNGRVYQKLYFFICSTIRCDHFHNQNVYMWIKTLEQKIKKPDTCFSTS